MNSRLKLLVVTISSCLLVLLLIGGHLGKSASTDEGAYRQIKVFTEVLGHIKSDYVEEPDLNNVTLGAWRTLLRVSPWAAWMKK